MDLPMYELTIEDVEKAIDEHSSEWVGRCYEIACKLVNSGLIKNDRAVAVYGHWTGPIHRDSFFASRKSHGFTQHGWISIPDEGIVIDPTRWAFEGCDPYIFIGEEPEDFIDFRKCVCGHIYDEHDLGFFNECSCCDCQDFEPEEPDWPYDEGGNTFREALLKPPPEFDPDDKCFDVNFGKATALVFTLLNDFSNPRKITNNQLFWLANLPYNHFNGMENIVYDEIKRVGLGAFIPLDNRERAEREKGETK